MAKNHKSFGKKIHHAYVIPETLGLEPIEKIKAIACINALFPPPNEVSKDIKLTPPQRKSVNDEINALGYSATQLMYALFESPFSFAEPEKSIVVLAQLMGNQNLLEVGHDIRLNQPMSWINPNTPTKEIHMLRRFLNDRLSNFPVCCVDNNPSKPTTIRRRPVFKPYMPTHQKQYL